MPYLDSVPMSGIIRIRDMMYGVADPFRLDQGDVSFDTPPSVKQGLVRAIADNRTHYLQTAGVPRLQELLAEKLRARNGIPVERPDQVFVSNGGIHALYCIWHALLEPGDEVIIPDPAWPPAPATVLSARGVAVPCPLHEGLDWRWDVGELRSRVSDRTKVIYLNSPNNPTGGVLTRRDLEQVAALARERGLTVVSDEAYEDLVFDGEHVSIAALPGMWERTIPVFTFSKSFAMTGLRLGYLAVRDQRLADRIRKVLFLTTGNVCSVVQYGGIAGLEGPQEVLGEFRDELMARRDFFYDGLADLAGVFTGRPPKGTFYAFVRIAPDWQARASTLEEVERAAIAAQPSISWALVDYLIRKGRVGCVPGADFGANGEGYVRFCFARGRAELTGALASMKTLFT